MGKDHLVSFLDPLSIVTMSVCIGLFEKREGRLREERDAALLQAESSKTERDAAIFKLQELSGRVDALTKDVEVGERITALFRVTWGLSSLPHTIFCSRLLRPSPDH